MKNSENEMVCCLINLLLKGYCPHISDKAYRGRAAFRLLILNISIHWDLETEQMFEADIFYRAHRKADFSNATQEKLAIFYIALKNNLSRGQVINLYLPIAKRERLIETPYWNCFVKEELAKEKPRVPLIALCEPLYDDVNALSKKLWKRLETVVNRVSLERRRK